MSTIRSFDYRRTLAELEGPVMTAVRRVLRSGRLILGPETEAFEHELATALGAPFCVAVTSGTAALHLALLALEVGPGDEVVTVANTCAPTIAAIRLTGARPVFVDVRTDDGQLDVTRLEAAITPRTRVVLPVHLWGHAVDLAPLLAIAEGHGLAVLEDCAQAQGTRYRGRQVGTFGTAGAFSFYPTKNLGAYGDAGAVVTADPELAARLRRRRTYGYDGEAVACEDGGNFRVAELQAAILRVKLPHLPSWLTRRRAIAARYRAAIRHPGIATMVLAPEVEPSYHQFVIRCRDRAAVIRALDRDDVQHAIHYPTPIHRMPAFRRFAPAPGALAVTEELSAEILSIPVHEALRDDEVERVVAALERTPRDDA